MSASNGKTSPPANRPARRLRIAGLAVLLAGIFSAGLLYWLRTRGTDLSHDLSMLEFDKPQRRQMELLYGKSGALFQEWINDLKEPRTQAVLIVIFSLIIFAVCFYFARLLNDEREPVKNHFTKEN